MKPDDLFCHRCGAKLIRVQDPAVKVCPKCSTIMRAGFIIERESPLSLWTYGSGVYWTPDEGGTIGNRIAVKAYACPQCGYIEHYIRYLEKDKATVERAPTGYSQ